jgi:hypothetical protein
MRMRNTALAVILVALALPAAAQPVRCVDASGKTHYIDASAAKNSGMKCEAVKGAANVVSTPPAASRPPARSGSASGSGSDFRDAIIAAEQRLAAARKALAEQEANREGGEKNYTRVEERLAPYREDVQNAERELEEARRQR